MRIRPVALLMAIRAPRSQEKEQHFERRDCDMSCVRKNTATEIPETCAVRPISDGTIRKRTKERPIPDDTPGNYPKEERLQ
jgi:hypothetical protein